ncbi:hypothetical protein B0J14DRAFT_360078 [Halenospora varia]|nr:hypothetical protein B0J14DRAFT_360078 [Halenospora varia]
MTHHTVTLSNKYQTPQTWSLPSSFSHLGPDKGFSGTRSNFSIGLSSDTGTSTPPTQKLPPSLAGTPGKKSKVALCTTIMENNCFAVPYVLSFTSEDELMNAQEDLEENSPNTPDRHTKAEEFSELCEGGHQSSKTRDKCKEPAKGTPQAMALEIENAGEHTRSTRYTSLSPQDNIKANNGSEGGILDEFSWLRSEITPGVSQEDTCTPSLELSFAPIDLYRDYRDSLTATVLTSTHSPRDPGIPPIFLDDNGANFLSCLGNCQPVYGARTFWESKNWHKNNLIPDSSLSLKRKERLPPDRPPDISRTKDLSTMFMPLHHASQLLGYEGFSFGDNSETYSTDWGPGHHSYGAKRRRVDSQEVATSLSMVDFPTYVDSIRSSSISTLDLGCNPLESPLILNQILQRWGSGRGTH